MLPSAPEIVPNDIALFEQKAPMGLASFGFEFGALGICELECCPVVDRRLPAGELALALQLDLVGRLIRGIKATARLQPLDRRFIKGETVRLAHLQRPAKP